MADREVNCVELNFVLMVVVCVDVEWCGTIGGVSCCKTIRAVVEGFRSPRNWSVLQSLCRRHIILRMKALCRLEAFINHKSPILVSLSRIQVNHGCSRDSVSSDLLLRARSLYWYLKDYMPLLIMQRIHAMLTKTVRMRQWSIQPGVC
jgi:hypothetical protein